MTCSGTTACYTSAGNDGAVHVSLLSRYDLDLEDRAWKRRVLSRDCQEYRVKEGVGAFPLFLLFFFWQWWFGISMMLEA